MREGHLMARLWLSPTSWRRLVSPSYVACLHKSPGPEVPTSPAAPELYSLQSASDHVLGGHSAPRYIHLWERSKQGGHLSTWGAPGPATWPGTRAPAVTAPHPPPASKCCCLFVQDVCRDSRVRSGLHWVATLPGSRCPQPPRPSGKGPCPHEHWGGSHHLRRWGEAVERRVWSSGERKCQEGVCVCVCVCVPMCTGQRVPGHVCAHRSTCLYPCVYPCVWCVCQVPFLHAPAPVSVCLDVLTPSACPPSSWQCTAGPGGCACPPDERWQVCNKPLVTVTFLSSISGLPGRSLKTGRRSWQASGCEAAHPPPGRAAA
ncbi:uncharacterized protein LOC111096013 [Canis lupus familiaris]|uniref:uncharacterized protein LOC111096013 n=1 Tax=Canis lupus familiaris TaxID=9615 RepID=UPI0018F42EBE|nr:uncharacterized protein LOC111096013 [Canis lupus familiaris]XP_038381529.1 uncharacterized protein LOC111096013 [Canis lupus familiaris]